MQSLSFKRSGKRVPSQLPLIIVLFVVVARDVVVAMVLNQKVQEAVFETFNVHKELAFVSLSVGHLVLVVLGPDRVAVPPLSLVSLKPPRVHHLNESVLDLAAFFADQRVDTEDSVCVRL